MDRLTGLRNDDCFSEALRGEELALLVPGRATEAVVEAKRRGRDRVVCAEQVREDAHRLAG
jgi:hypothetical protein